MPLPGMSDTSLPPQGPQAELQEALRQAYIADGTIDEEAKADVQQYINAAKSRNKTLQGLIAEMQGGESPESLPTAQQAIIPAVVVSPTVASGSTGSIPPLPVLPPIGTTGSDTIGAAPPSPPTIGPPDTGGNIIGPPDPGAGGAGNTGGGTAGCVPPPPPNCPYPETAVFNKDTCLWSCSGLSCPPGYHFCQLIAGGPFVCCKDDTTPPPPPKCPPGTFPRFNNDTGKWECCKLEDGCTVDLSGIETHLCTCGTLYLSFSLPLWATLSCSVQTKCEDPPDQGRGGSGGGNLLPTVSGGAQLISSGTITSGGSAGDTGIGIGTEIGGLPDPCPPIKVKLQVCCYSGCAPPNVGFGQAVLGPFASCSEAYDASSRYVISLCGKANTDGNPPPPPPKCNPPPPPPPCPDGYNPEWDNTKCVWNCVKVNCAWNEMLVKDCNTGLWHCVPMACPDGFELIENESSCTAECRKLSDGEAIDNGRRIDVLADTFGAICAVITGDETCITDN